VGNVTKAIGTGAATQTFEIGSSGAYTPVNLAFNNVTVAGTLTASTTAGDHPSISTSGIASGKSVNRYWTVTNNGVAFDSYSVTLNLVAADVDAGSSTSSFVVRKFDTPSWLAGSAGTKTATSTQATGITSFSDFAVGELQS